MKRKAFVAFDPKSLVTKHEVLQRVMKSQHKSPCDELYMMKMSVTCDLYCTQPVFRALKDELQRTMEEEYEDCQVSIADTKKTPPDKRIHVIGETYSAVVTLRRKLQMIIRPEIVYFDDLVTEEVSHVRIDKVLSKLAAETLPGLLRKRRAHALVHVRRQVVMIYGSDADREVLKSDLKDYISFALKTMFREIDISSRSGGQKGKAMRMLIRRFGPGLEELKKTCRVKSITIDLKGNLLYIDGTDEGYIKLVQEVDESLKDKSQTNVTLSTEVEQDECGACFSPPTDGGSKPYRLAACGHFFCSACLRDYLKTFVTSKRFPIQCPSCDESIMLCDIKNICPQEEQRLELFKVGLDAHIVSNPKGNIKFCPGPDCCMVYLKDDEGVAHVCDECGYCFCNCCGKEAHPDGMNCKEFRLLRLQLRLQRAERVRYEEELRRQEQQRKDIEERRRIERRRERKQREEEEMRIRIMIEQQRQEYERIREVNRRKKRQQELEQQRQAQAELERIRVERKREEERERLEIQQRLEQERRRRERQQLEDRQREAARNLNAQTQNQKENKCVIL